MELKRALRWTWVLVAAVLIYAAATVLLRWRANRAIDEASALKRAESDRKILEQLGGDQMKVLTFYANPPVLTRGERGLLCYGVANTKAVRIEPQVEEIKPALSRCIEVKPSTSTTYTLTASDAAGRVETRAVEIVVR